MDYLSESPDILREFLIYHENIKGQSLNTVNEYFLDLRMFFRFIKIIKDKVPRLTELEEISITDVDIELVSSVTLSDVYEYMNYLSHHRAIRQNSDSTDYGIGAAARARKISSIRSFYKYLTNKARLLEENPMQELEFPRIRKSLPKYLTLEESVTLLSNVNGKYRNRDFAILMVFLNCGIRISELAGLNLSDYHENRLRILGKGNKERFVYLNDNCIDAINDYLNDSDTNKYREQAKDKRPIFLSQKCNRISTSTIHALVKKHLLAAGLDQSQYSAHKLRHTAATLMLGNGVDVKTLQELLGHEHLNTTEIYTHVENTELQIAARANPLSKIKFHEKTDMPDDDQTL